MLFRLLNQFKQLQPDFKTCNLELRSKKNKPNYGYRIY